MQTYEQAAMIYEEALVDAKAAGGDAVKIVNEVFTRVNAMLTADDKGWVPLSGFSADDQEFGLDLDALKAWSRQLREEMTGAPWMGRGFRLRHSYVWKDGIRYGNIPAPTKGKKNLQEIIDRPGNQLHFFGQGARKRREGRLYSDGVAFWVGNEKTKNIEAIPLWQITDQITDPDGLGLAWAYKREWPQRDLHSGKVTNKTLWYFTDQFKDKRIPKIKVDPNGASPIEEEVSQDSVILDLHANRLDGFVYGSPDALAASAWQGYARDAYMDGRTMQKALASFAFKASVGSAQGGNKAALAFGSPQGAGQTAVMGGANDLVPVSSAGKGYDFDSIRALVAVVATALDVSVIALTANPGDAGSSYGASQTLDLPTRLSMEARRSDHVDFDKRVLRFLGMTEEPDVTFKPYDDGAEVYRSAQALLLEYGADVMTRQELRDRLDDLHGLPNGTVPTEAQRPSVLLAKATAKAVPPAAPAAPASDDGDGAKASVASPAQGRSNGTGGQNGGSATNDLRQDTIN